MSGRLRVFVVVTALLLHGVAATSDPVEAAAPPDQRVYVVADSVGLGAKSAIPDAFPADWRVTVEGKPAQFVEGLEQNWVRPRIATDPGAIGDHAVVAAGYNYPYWDPERFDRSIDSMIETLLGAGVKHVYWVTLREVKPEYISGAAWRQVQPYYWYFPTVNEHLERALDRHPELTLVDWAANANQTGLTYDAIHLNTTGAALYSDLIRSAVMSAPTRVGERSTTRIAIPNPTGVAAVAVNLTTTEPRHRGFLTAYDCVDPRPTVSNHNYVRGQTVAHATIVPVGPTGEICVFSLRATNLVVDVTGRFGSDLAAGASERLLDTRDGLPQPPHEPAVIDTGSTNPAAFTITAVGAEGRGWVRLAPCGDDAETSNLNVVGPDANPNAAFVRPAADGTVCLTASVPTHLVLDRLVEVPSAPASEPDAPVQDRMVVQPPRRVVDTRDTVPVPAGGLLRLSAAQLGLDQLETPARGVLLNLTGTRSGRGFVRAFGCDDTEPSTSNLNVSPGQVVANLVIVSPDADGDICLRSSTTTDLVVDVQGHVVDGFEGTALRVLDTRG